MHFWLPKDLGLRDLHVTIYFDGGEFLKHYWDLSDFMLAWLFY